VAISDGDVLGTAFGTAVAVLDAAQSTPNKLYQSAESAAVTIAGTPATGDLVYFRLSRNSGHVDDTHAEDARCLGLVLHLTTDAMTDA
jgi:hypothetical protein